ncbi:MAG: GAF domain-containing protein, partial [Acidimicrobiales bacterium]
MADITASVRGRTDIVAAADVRAMHGGVPGWHNAPWMTGIAGPGRGTARPGDESATEASLYQVARALGEAITGRQVAETVFDHALRQLGAATVGLWVRGDDDMIRMTAGAGTPLPDAHDEIGEIPLDADLPAATVVRTGAALSYATTAERDARWPVLKGVSGASSVVVLPLVARGRAIGCLHIGWPEVRDFRPDIARLEALADLCSAAVDRADLYERERRARETLEFLNQGTRLMVSRLEPDEIVRALVRLAVPRLAPWCAVYVHNGDDIDRVALEIVGDPELADRLRTIPP